MSTTSPTCTWPSSRPAIFASTSSGALVGTTVISWSPAFSTDPTETLATDITVPSCSARNSTSWRRNCALFSDFPRIGQLAQHVRQLLADVGVPALDVAVCGNCRSARHRGSGEGTAGGAEAERDRLVVEQSQARQAIAEVERRTTVADAACAAAELAAKQAHEATEALRQAAETDRRATVAEVAMARAQRDAAQETATTTLRQAQSEAEEARRALTAAAEERGRLLQRVEAAEAQRSGRTEATAPIDAKPGRSRGTRTGTGEKPAT
jgi:hypothetical protein